MKPFHLSRCTLFHTFCLFYHITRNNQETRALKQKKCDIRQFISRCAVGNGFNFHSMLIKRLDVRKRNEYKKPVLYGYCYKSTSTLSFPLIFVCTEVSFIILPKVPDAIHGVYNTHIMRNNMRNSNLRFPLRRNYAVCLLAVFPVIRKCYTSCFNQSDYVTFGLHVLHAGCVLEEQKPLLFCHFWHGF